FQPENVLLLTQDGGADRAPRRNALIAQLRSWCQRPAADDLMLVAFCGHGREVDGAAYLLPADAQPADLPMTSLSLDFVKTTLQSCPARTRLLLLDACHSGGGRDLVVMTP